MWIAGLHAGVWPEAPRPNPFLPLALQRAAGMPHSSPERELSYARRITARLLDSAPEVVCSYPLFSGEEKLWVSPLIEALPENFRALAQLSKPRCAGFSPLRVPLDPAKAARASAAISGRHPTAGRNECFGESSRVPLSGFCDSSPGRPRV